MIRFEWDDDYSVGVDAIDAEHRKFIELIDGLYRAIQGTFPPGVVESVFRGLYEYAGEHFATEERLMSQFRYPYFAEHKASHEGFIRDLARIQENFEKGDGNLVTLELTVFMKSWLVRHIADTDKTLGAFLVARREAPSATLG